MAHCDFGETQGRGRAVYRCRHCGFTLRAVWPITAECRRIELVPKVVACRACGERQGWLNRASDLVSTKIKLGDRVAAVAGPVQRVWRWLTNWRPPRTTILLRFPHGLGDCVQLSPVLRHIRELHPHVDVDIVVGRGKGKMLSHLCRNVFEDHEPPGPYDQRHDVFADEPGGEGWHGHPSTKAEWILRRLMSIEPRNEWCGYDVAWDAGDALAASAFIDRHGLESRRYMLLHYQGITKRNQKNAGEEFVAAHVCRAALARGITPIVLNHSAQSNIRLPGVLRLGEADGLSWDACFTAALADHAAGCFGIDSGPGHVFCSRRLKTPTLILWGGHFPGHYMPPAPHVLHVVPSNYWHHAANHHALGYFLEHYQYAISPGTTDLVLRSATEAVLDDKIAEFAAAFYDRRWVGLPHFDVSDVLDRIAGRPDALLHAGIGEPPHCEADQILARWPGVACYGWEPDEAARRARPRYPGPLRPFGLWNKPTTLWLQPVRDLGQTSFLPGLVGRVPEPGPARKIAVETLDDWARTTHAEFRHAILWADVEGAELKVLAGARGLLAAGRIGWVYVEISAEPRRAGEPTAAELDEFLARYGFRPIYDRVEGGASFDRLYALD